MWSICVARLLLVATTMVFMLLDHTSLAVSECPDGFTFIESVSGCYRLLLSNLDWSSAGQQCRALHDHAHLVVIGDAAEQHALHEFLERRVQRAAATHACRKYGGRAQLWTAAQRVIPTGEEATPFVWKVPSADGRRTRTSHMTYTNWLSGQPDFWRKNEHCGSLKGDSSYQWNDESCSILNCAVCEIDLDD